MNKAATCDTCGNLFRYRNYRVVCVQCDFLACSLACYRAEHACPLLETGVDGDVRAHILMRMAHVWCAVANAAQTETGPRPKRPKTAS